MLFLSIILSIGLLTTFTDLKYKKIYNAHLAIAAVAGLMAAAYAAVFRHDDVLFHIINGLAAFVIGFFLHRSALWRGGDAKLFALYAFLMPPPVFSHTPCPAVVSLFACSFIAGAAILIPVFIKDIIINRRAIAGNLFLPVNRQALLRAIIGVIFYSWILLPFYYLARITNSVIILTVTYLIFNLLYKNKNTVKEASLIKFFKKNLVEFAVGIVFGFLMRLWLAPNSLSFPVLARSIVMVTLFTTISVCIQTTLDHLKEYRDRVSFAPLLFIGCVLSYTPFLTWLMRMVSQWNVLISR